jgi:hypothetical protein
MTRRRMLTVFYDPDAREVLECRFSDAWLTGGSWLRLDTLTDLVDAVTQAREVETGIWAAKLESLGKGRRDVH